MGTLGYSVNEAFFFFKVKYIEKKKNRNAVLWGYIGQFIFGFLQYYRFYEVALSKLSGSFNVFFNEGVQGKSIFRGTQRKLLRKRPKNNNKA